VAKYGTARQTIDDKVRRMRTAYWIIKATDTFSEYVIHIALLLQQWLRERYTYISFLTNWHYVEVSG
jgi:hypothetical protein